MSEPAALKIVFAGTPEFAARHLESLLTTRHQIVSVYTQPDRPAGRGKKLHASPVKTLAQSAGLPLHQPATLKDPMEQAQLTAAQADLMVVVAYGLLLPQAVLDAPRLGCINVHASLLPRWRGAAPIQRAIEAGDKETGITIMQMEAGLDTGPMLLRSTCPIEATDTAGDLHNRLAALGPPSLLEALDHLAGTGLAAQAQDHSQATYAHKLSKEEARINWHQPATEIARRIRAFNPFPVAFTELDGERLRIFAAQPLNQPHRREPGTLLAQTTTLEVACGQETRLRLEQVQLPGKKAVPVQALLHGIADRFSPGRRFH